MLSIQQTCQPPTGSQAILPTVQTEIGIFILSSGIAITDDYIKPMGKRYCNKTATKMRRYNIKALTNSSYITLPFITESKHNLNSHS